MGDMRVSFFFVFLNPGFSLIKKKIPRIRIHWIRLLKKEGKTILYGYACYDIDHVSLM
jgi:hypothetical protein